MPSSSGHGRRSLAAEFSQRELFRARQVPLPRAASSLVGAATHEHEHRYEQSELLGTIFSTGAVGNQSIDDGQLRQTDEITTGQDA